MTCWFILLASLQLISAYHDYMTHTALDKVPGTLGESVQLRCTKIIETLEDDYMVNSVCDPQYNDNCFHSWSKDGIPIETKRSSKYSVDTQITFDYCANFQWTSDLVNRFGFISQIDNDNYYNNDMKCYSSALIINSVDASDFGMYTCNFTDHSYTDSYYKEYASTQNITLYDSADSSITQLRKVEYFENFYTKGLRSKLLMQCVTTGGSLNWFVHVSTESCDRWQNYKYDSCVNDTTMKIEDLTDKDVWRCFTYKIEKHTPHEGIIESFIYFENVCAVDWGTVFCAADESAAIQSNDAGYIVEKQEWDHYYYYYDSRDIAVTVAVVVIIPVLSILLIIAIILACVRGRTCTSCCTGGGTQVQPRYNIRYVPAPVQA